MENTHTPEVGQIRISDSGHNHRKITKLSSKMLWYVDCDKHGSPLRHKEYRIWIKNADLYLGEPLAAYQAREEAKYQEQVKKSMQDSFDKYAEVYKALS